MYARKLSCDECGEQIVEESGEEAEKRCLTDPPFYTRVRSLPVQSGIAQSETSIHFCSFPCFEVGTRRAFDAALKLASTIDTASFMFQMDVSKKTKPSEPNKIE